MQIVTVGNNTRDRLYSLQVVYHFLLIHEKSLRGAKVLRNRYILSRIICAKCEKTIERKRKVPIAATMERYARRSEMEVKVITITIN